MEEAGGQVAKLHTPFPRQRQEMLFKIAMCHMQAQLAFKGRIGDDAMIFKP